MSKRPGSNKSNLLETRDIFIKHGLKEFVKYGYADASTNRIVEAAGMARGSLYYHFKDKKGLFEAVFEHVITEAQTFIAAEADKGTSNWDQLIRTAEAYLDLCATAAFRKIILIESQAAMEFSKRMAIHARTIRPIVESRLEKLANDGLIKRENIPSIAYFVYGTSSEMGRSLDSSKNIKADKEKFKATFRELAELIMPN